MSRTYETTIPSRPEMIKIIRAAFDNGVTLFDTAEAYGPFECERILGESIAPFRNKVVIETKFGWNIDQNTGQCTCMNRKLVAFANPRFQCKFGQMNCHGQNCFRSG
jgi:aryl-alcohol dehydrogenase-like predicted oxidoreductase